MCVCACVCVQLEGSCVELQTQVNQLQREVLGLTEDLDEKDKLIAQLTGDLAQAKEEVAKMQVLSHTDSCPTLT